MCPATTLAGYSIKRTSELPRRPSDHVYNACCYYYCVVLSGVEDEKEDTVTLKDIEKLAVDFQRGKITAEEFKLKTVSETTQLTKNELDELALRITRIGASEGDG